MEQIIRKPQESDDIINLEEFTNSGKIPPLGKKYKVRIDYEYYIFDHHLVNGREILKKADIEHVECHTLYQKFRDCDFEKIDLEETVDLSKPGIEHFIIKKAEVFYYTVDGEPETTDQKELTPNQILEYAGILPLTDYYLVQIESNGSQISYKDNPNTPIIMKCPPMKFVSAFKGETPVS